MVTRREFVKTVTMAGASLALFKGSEFSVWAFAQSPPLRKFIAPLPGLGPQGIPIANPINRYSGADYYELAAQQFKQQMHPDLPNPTTLWGYADLSARRNAYLGPIIAAHRDRPSIVRMYNRLPNQHPLPVDATLLDDDPNMEVNRITVHLHGGFSSWNMDGGPFTWYSASGNCGVSCLNQVPGIPNAAEYYYPNQQSARLMWYHDHAMGLTRLNAYAGLASGYLLLDPVMDELTNPASGPPLIPPLQYTIPLILQEKTFKKVADQWGQPGDLWYPYEYEWQGATSRWDRGEPSDGFTDEGAPKVPSCVPEFFGDTTVINGEAYPYLEVEPRRYRFMLLNGAQARFFNLNLFYESMMQPQEPDFTKAGPAFVQIGTEGGVLPAPVLLNHPPRLMPQDGEGCVDPNGPHNLLLAPAERADLIIDFSTCRSGDRLILYNDAPAPFPCGDVRNDYFTGDPDLTPIGGASPTQPGYGPNTRTLMQIRVVGLKGAPDPMNSNSTYAGLLNVLPTAYRNSHVPYGEFDLDPNQAGIIRQNKTLNEDFDGYGRLIQRLGTDQHLYDDSFGRNYMDEPTEVYRSGDTVIWDIYNTTGDTHPMHFHLVNVQVVGSAPFTNVGVPDGPFAPPDANYRGWKETVRINPGQVARVIMKFALPKVPFKVPPSPRTGGNEYVWHCHILEHEEHDMMRPLIVR